jgi:hypothetical protein
MQPVHGRRARLSHSEILEIAPRHRDMTRHLKLIRAIGKTVFI